MPVAKSYKDLPRLCEPFETNGRMYTKIQMKNGNEKTVRWYTVQEYQRMYGEAADDVVPKRIRSRKDVLGFEAGPITIFKGNTYEDHEYFQMSSARYNKWFGWHFISTDTVPDDLPEDVEPVKLEWEQVANGDELKSDAAIKSVVESLIYEDTGSEYIGEIGERIEFIGVVEKIIPFDGFYGPSNMYIFKTYDGNEVVWTTSAKKNYKIGDDCHIKGTIKDLKVYRGSKQTVMTRCTDVN